MVKKSNFWLCYKFLDLAAMGVERGPIFQILKFMQIHHTLTPNRFQRSSIVIINYFQSISSIKIVFCGQKMMKNEHVTSFWT
jgi:hypothetical protein